jgi:hypothetical protein
MTSAAHQATEPSPLLSVIYPVFDVRGDAVERIRLWTEKQNLEPDRYRVFVVADAETSLDEVRLRQVLRSHDVILRVPERETDIVVIVRELCEPSSSAGRAGASDCRCFLSGSSPTIATDYFPGHDGLRFSPNALRPSLASSVIARSAIWLSV